MHLLWPRYYRCSERGLTAIETELCSIILIILEDINGKVKPDELRL